MKKQKKMLGFALDVGKTDAGLMMSAGVIGSMPANPVQPALLQGVGMASQIPVVGSGVYALNSLHQLEHVHKKKRTL